MTVVMGLNGSSRVGHDAGVALVIDGHVVAAVEEERLVRVKRAYNLPPVLAAEEALSLAGIAISDVDVVAYPWVPAAMGLADDAVTGQIDGWLHGLGGRRNDTKVRFIEHHVAHAWCGLAFVPGGIRERRAGVLVLDGSGESTAGACYRYEGGRLRRQWILAQSSSLGIYYEAVSQYLGFGWGEEGKTMGLAAYGCGPSRRVPRLPDRRFDGPLPGRRRHRPSPRLDHDAVRSRLVGRFRRLNGDCLSLGAGADVARAAQDVIAERIVEYVTELADDVDVVVLSGGVALNCSINADVAALCRIRGIELVIPPPASDTGVALGAALAACEEPANVAPVTDPFLGRAFDVDSIARQLHDEGMAVEDADARSVAEEMLERSLVCGWFEGRSEVGPRALGKRTIIARADSAAVRDRVNVLKGREAWRPLAPSVTVAEFDRSFPGSTPSAHMLIAASVSPGAVDRLRGVVHADGTSRPQVVAEPGPYRDLLHAVGAAGGTEAVICTSFNRAGEPIVYSPAHALGSARAMGLDLLAGDGWCLRLPSCST